MEFVFWTFMGLYLGFVRLVGRPFPSVSFEGTGADGKPSKANSRSGEQSSLTVDKSKLADTSVHSSISTYTYT